jgi:hypothetical protein
VTLQALYHCDCHWAFCDTCRTKHPILALGPMRVEDAYRDWQEKHKGHHTLLAGPQHVEALARRHERKLKRLHRRLRSYATNANVNVAFQAEQTPAVTALISLANSATAGWKGAYIDNSANLYLDDLTYFIFPLVNTAPANDKAIYLFGYQGLDTTNFTTSGAAANDGTEAALTYPNVTTSAVVMPRIGTIPYTTQNVAFVSPVFSYTGALGLAVMPIYFGYGIINYSGMTLSATTAQKRRGVYLTVV